VTLALGEELAGAVIAVIIATGQALESSASARASRELSALLDPRAADRAPRYHGGHGDHSGR